MRYAGRYRYKCHLLLLQRFRPFVPMIRMSKCKVERGGTGVPRVRCGNARQKRWLRPSIIESQTESQSDNAQCASCESPLVSTHIGSYQSPIHPRRTMIILPPNLQQEVKHSLDIPRSRDSMQSLKNHLDAFPILLPDCVHPGNEEREQHLRLTRGIEHR